MSDTTLTERATEWLKQQPEYPLLFLADRRTRRRASVLLARTFFTLPTSTAPAMSRKQKREMMRDVQRTISKAKTRMSRRGQRRLNAAIRQRNRFGRLSVKRMEELAAREAEAEARRLEMEAAQEYSDAALTKAAEDEALYASIEVPPGRFEPDEVMAELRELERGDMESTDPALD